VLRGLGVTLSLPLLESLVPRRAIGQTALPPKRFVPMYFPNGAGVEWWDKPGAGKTWDLGPLLRPLEPVKSKALFIKNLGNYTWRRDLLTMSPAWYSLIPRADIGTMMPAGAFNTPSHSRDPGAMLTCVDGDGVRQDRKLDVVTSPVNATTADQIIAQGLAGKTPIVAAVETTAERRPRRLRLSVVKGFRKKEVERLAERDFAAGSNVVSDGLSCWPAVEKAGCQHFPMATGSGKRAASWAPFKWINTCLGNIKTAIAGTYHHVSAKHAQSYLTSFAYRFNRRFQLDSIVERLAWAAVHTDPQPYRVVVSDA